MIIGKKYKEDMHSEWKWIR